MSDGFGASLLSQVTALDRKLSIARDRENLPRNTKHDEHRRHADYSAGESPGDQPGEAETSRSTGDSQGKIDITI